jgi:hypothetical protein
MRNKKAQGLSMSTIIIAAISLLVLVLLATFLLTAGGDINEGTSCQAISGASCEYPEDCSDMSGFISRGQKNCDDGEVCCTPLG